MPLPGISSTASAIDLPAQAGINPGGLIDGLAIYAAGLFTATASPVKSAGRNTMIRNLPEDSFCSRSAVSTTSSRRYRSAPREHTPASTPNINLNVKSTGMAGSTRGLYVLSHNTKFGVIQDVDRRDRLAAEAAWTCGPLAVFGEYFTLNYRDLVPAGSPERDAEVSSWYAATVFALTGEPVIIENGRIMSLIPDRPLNLAGEAAYGAFCIAGRFEHFDGDADWINPDAFVSVRDADAYSIAADWIMTRELRLIFDFTHTRLSDPIRVRVLPDGSVDYIDEENVLTMRFSLDF